MMKRKSIIHTVAILALTVLAGSASAHNMRQVHSGVECQPQVPDLAENFYYWFNGVQNVGSDTLPLTCPVLRANAGNVDGTSAFKIQVRSNGFDFLSCTFYSLDKDGNIIALNSDATSSDVPVSLDLDVDTSAVNGFYSVACDVPPSGWVYGYKLTEF